MSERAEESNWLVSPSTKARHPRPRECLQFGADATTDGVERNRLFPKNTDGQTNTHLRLFSEIGHWLALTSRPVITG